MKLQMICSCGAKFNAEDAGTWNITLMKEAKEWRDMHVKCLDRIAPAELQPTDKQE